MKFFNKFFLAFGICILLSGAASFYSITFQIKQFSANHWGQNHGCHTDVQITKRNLKKCTINSGIGRPLYLFGDSNADQFSEALIDVGEQTKRSILISTISGCPFVPYFVNAPQKRWTKKKSDDCINYYKSAILYLKKAPKGDVVIAFSDQYFREIGWKIGPSAFESTEDKNLRLKLLIISLKNSISQIESFGHKVFFILTIPQLNYLNHDGYFIENTYTPSLCSKIRILFFKCDRTLEHKNYVLEQLPIALAEIKALDRLKVKYLDVYSNLCTDSNCTNRSNFSWIYRDGAHISVGESAKLAKLFQKLLSV